MISLSIKIVITNGMNSKSGTFNKTQARIIDLHTTVVCYGNVSNVSIYLGEDLHHRYRKK